MTSDMISLISRNRKTASFPPAPPSVGPNRSNHPYGSDGQIRELLKKSMGIDVLVAFIKDPTPAHETALRERWERSSSLQELIPDPEQINSCYECRKKLFSLMLEDLRTSFIQNPAYLALGDLHEEYKHCLHGIRK